jgi:hypothetical protein
MGRPPKAMVHGSSRTAVDGGRHTSGSNLAIKRGVSNPPMMTRVWNGEWSSPPIHQDVMALPPTIDWSERVV